MNTLIKLSRQDIETRYLNKPILIDNKWYIVSDIDTTMPPHMLTSKEADSCDKDESNIKGIEVFGVEGKAYVMWIYFNQEDREDGWDAYGYEK